MTPIGEEITQFVRACEHLLSRNQALTSDERDLVQYYCHELSQYWQVRTAQNGLDDHPVPPVPLSTPASIETPTPSPKR